MVAYSFKARFVTPIRNGRKRQTIRAVGKRRHAREGDTLQLYTAMRTKQCEQIGVARCTSVRPITIRVCTDGDLLVTLNRRMLTETERDKFALADGFKSAEDMWLFWRKEHPGVEYFNGVLIEWE